MTDRSLRLATARERGRLAASDSDHRRDRSLRREGEAYARFLQNSGAAASVTRYAEVTHEFFSMATIIDQAKQAVTEAATGLKTAFGD